MASDNPFEARLSDLHSEGRVLVDCLMTRDYDEARRSALLLRQQAKEMRLEHVQALAERVALLLGASGSDPSIGLEPAVLALVAALEEVGSD